MPLGAVTPIGSILPARNRLRAPRLLAPARARTALRQHAPLQRALTILNSVLSKAPDCDVFASGITGVIKKYYLNMPYKIVQTYENGRTLLTAVPDGWEENGWLSWPKKHEKLRRVENSLPEINCRKIKCTVKRRDVPNFSQAESEIDRMSNLSDTETDNDNNQRTKKYIKNSTKSNNQNYNIMARECSMMQQQLQNGKENWTTQDTESQHSLLLNSQNEILLNSLLAFPQSVPPNSDISMPAQKQAVAQNIEESSEQTAEDLEVIPEKYTTIEYVNSTIHMMVAENNSALPPVQDSTISNTIEIDGVLAIVLQKLEQIQADVKTIAENQQTLFQSQNNLLLKLAENQTQLEEVIRLSSKPTVENKTPDVGPVSNKKELQELELKLANPEFNARLRNTVEVVCSKGKNRGVTNAYALIDLLFERSFLCQCSWAGGSRSDQSKICLKSFTNIFDLFFSVLHKSDPDFNKPDCEKFLKTVLKNSRQRCASKQIRVSTMRKRQKVRKITSVSPTKVSNSVELLDQEKENEEEKKSKKPPREPIQGPRPPFYDEPSSEDETLC